MQERAALICLFVQTILYLYTNNIAKANVAITYKTRTNGCQTPLR